MASFAPSILSSRQLYNGTGARPIFRPNRARSTRTFHWMNDNDFLVNKVFENSYMENKTHGTHPFSKWQRRDAVIAYSNTLLALHLKTRILILVITVCLPRFSPFDRFVDFVVLCSFSSFCFFLSFHAPSRLNLSHMPSWLLVWRRVSSSWHHRWSNKSYV